MNRNEWERHGRRVHRWLGMAVVGFLLISVGTGLLWANARYLYWPDRYKEKIRPLPAIPITLSVMAIPDLRKRLPGGANAGVEQIILKSDFGLLVYEVILREQGKKRTIVVDAESGTVLSPLSDGLAARIAQQYVRTPAAVTRLNRESYLPRKKHTPVDAIRVSFDDPDNTQIVLDAASGEIIEDEGRQRMFHFFVMQLHQLNFFGFEKTLLNVPGIPLLFMALSGLVVWWVQWQRRRRADRTVSGALEETALAPASTKQ